MSKTEPAVNCESVDQKHWMLVKSPILLRCLPRTIYHYSSWLVAIFQNKYETNLMHYT